MNTRPNLQRTHAANSNKAGGGAALWRKQRYHDLLAKGSCPNHTDRDVAIGKRQCQECLDRTKRHRLDMLTKGKCFIHPGRDVVPGKTKCQECLDYQKQRRLDMLAKGKCHCGRNVLPGKKWCQKCSDYHINIAKARRRAKEMLVPFEDVDRRVVFERDEWTCQHCRKHVNGDACADHIVPLSLGGPHTYWNHQCLCATCNGSKSDDIASEPKLAHLVHLPIRKLIEAFAKERGAKLPRGWWEIRRDETNN